MLRNGGLLIYDGKLDNAMSLLKWLTDLENLKIDGRIEEVKKAEMMEKRKPRLEQKIDK